MTGRGNSVHGIVTTSFRSCCTWTSALPTWGGSAGVVRYISTADILITMDSRVNSLAAPPSGKQVGSIFADLPRSDEECLRK
jgi:hypothetical protein